MGGVLLQKGDDGFLYLVAFASRKLTDAEMGYGASELEMCMHWLVQHWDDYVRYNRFTMFVYRLRLLDLGKRKICLEERKWKDWKMVLT